MQIFIGQSVDTTILDESVNCSSSCNNSALDPAIKSTGDNTQGNHFLF